MALSKVDFNSINVTPAASKAIKFNSSNNGLETGDIGGSLVWISEQTASSSGTISFTSGIDSTYKEYQFHFTDIHNKHIPLIDEDVLNIVVQHQHAIENMIDYERAYLIDYFGFKTLERAYLMRTNGKVIERPQHMWLRVALGIHKNDFVDYSSARGLANVKETYDLMSQKYFTHATPTLFNSATPRPQLSSCYLISMENDSIDGIYNTLKEQVRDNIRKEDLLQQVVNLNEEDRQKVLTLANQIKGAN